jgi:hypothetical protein
MTTEPGTCGHVMRRCGIVRASTIGIRLLSIASNFVTTLREGNKCFENKVVKETSEPKCDKVTDYDVT